MTDATRAPAATVAAHASAPRLAIPLLFAIGSGVCLAINGRINGELSVRSHVALLAATMNFATGLVVVLAVIGVRRVVTGARVRERHPSRWWFWLGGLGAAVGQWSLSTGVPRIGVSLAALCFAAGLNAGGLSADGLGFGPGGRQKITPRRILSAALAVAAVAIAVSGGLHGAGQVPYLLFCVAGGFSISWQQPVNGRLMFSLGDPMRVMVVSFLGGLVALGTILAIQHPTIYWPSELWLYTGGVIASMASITSLLLIGRLGALRLSVAIVGGQLTGAALLDAIVPVEGTHLTVEKVIGAGIALSAVVLVSGKAPARFRRREVVEAQAS